MTQYPDNLVEAAKKALTTKTSRHDKPPPLPCDAILHELFNSSFQASLLTEEGRRPGFRLIYMRERGRILIIERTGSHLNY
jgi:hypothetical protein